MTYEVACNLFYEDSIGDSSQQLTELIESGLTLSYQQWLDNKVRVEVLSTQPTELIENNKLDFVLTYKVSESRYCAFENWGTGNTFF